MYSNYAAKLYQEEPMWHSIACDNNAQASGAPLNFDVTEISGGTTSKGVSVSNDMAVSSFGEKPSTANARFPVGVVEKTFSAGDHRRIISLGPANGRIKNIKGNSVTLAVGTLLVQSPGNDWFEPLYTTNDDASAQSISDHGCARAYVRKSTVIAATTVATGVPIFVFGPTPPTSESLIRNLFGDITATRAGIILGITRGYGRIVRSGFGASAFTVTSNGTLALDIKIAGTSIWTNQPLIDCADAPDGFHSLGDTAVPGSGTGPGTLGRYGVLKAASFLEFSPNQKITADLTETGTVLTNTDLHIQTDVVYY